MQVINHNNGPCTNHWNFTSFQWGKLHFTTTNPCHWTSVPIRAAAASTILWHINKCYWKATNTTPTSIPLPQKKNYLHRCNLPFTNQSWLSLINIPVPVLTPLPVISTKFCNIGENDWSAVTVYHHSLLNKGVLAIFYSSGNIKQQTSAILWARPLVIPSILPSTI